jgi:hypothetical protein
MEKRLISTDAGWGNYRTSAVGAKAYVCPKCGGIVYSAEEIHRLQWLGKQIARKCKKGETNYE